MVTRKMRADCEGEVKNSLSAEMTPGPHRPPGQLLALSLTTHWQPFGVVYSLPLSSLGFQDFTSLGFPVLLVTPFGLCRWLPLVSLACWGSPWTPSLSTHLALSS